jgi:hypothetical protein
MNGSRKPERGERKPVWKSCEWFTARVIFWHCCIEKGSLKKRPVRTRAQSEGLTIGKSTPTVSKFLEARPPSDCERIGIRLPRGQGIRRPRRDRLGRRFVIDFLRA